MIRAPRATKRPIAGAARSAAPWNWLGVWEPAGAPAAGVAAGALLPAPLFPPAEAEAPGLVAGPLLPAPPAAGVGAAPDGGAAG